MKNIIFIGGIHGVGKSTISKLICKELNIAYLSASKLLKWSSAVGATKNISNLTENQNKLLYELENSNVNGLCMLDGHYSLLDNNSNIALIPIEVFKKINPIILVIKLELIAEIRRRLEERDNKEYDVQLLTKMQEKELNHAVTIANTLEVELLIINGNNINDAIDRIKIYSNESLT